jgi:uracil-DNA glycosylase
MHSSWTLLFKKYNFDLSILYNNKEVYPPQELVFRVFEIDVKDIKIVLLGQDPYHGPNQANGLSFSVSNDVKIPPSLKNIFKELKIEFPDRNYNFINGNLEKWFNNEKIFLLNSSLTVEKGKPSSHIKYWETFTNDVIKYISLNNDQCIFLLLGNYAKSKSVFIENKNNIITAPHPSPLARGFIGSNVFKQIEEKIGIIDWSN